MPFIVIFKQDGNLKVSDFRDDHMGSYITELLTEQVGVPF